MKRVTLDKRLFTAVIIIIILAGLMPFFFRAWDQLFISKNETNESGIKEIQINETECESECCVSGPAIKHCEGNLRCINSTCVKNECPLECCLGIIYESKKCKVNNVCIENVCRPAKELCGNGKCDTDHLECLYCQDECMGELLDGELVPLYSYSNETNSCEPYYLESSSAEE